MGTNKPPAHSATKIAVDSFGVLDDGREIARYTLKNSQGTQVSIIDLGATVTELHTADAKGQFTDIVLGFDEPQSYLVDSPYFGAIVGRYGNRIAQGRFNLDGDTYTLPINDGDNHLHGGKLGFDKRLWDAKIVAGNAVQFSLVSSDGDQGYPGQVNLTATYTLDDNNCLTVEYLATTTKPTVLNVTQHSYFNLAGHASGDVLKHRVMINAEHYTPVDAQLIPSGEIASVEGSPFDFRQQKGLMQDINADHEQITFGGGFDHNWVLTPEAAAGQQPAVTVFDPGSGRTLSIHTTEPGVQFYTGNCLDGTVIGKGGTTYHHRSGFCFETQHFPDSPNKPGFPSTRLNPGEVYKSTTSFTFGAIR